MNYRAQIGGFYLTAVKLYTFNYQFSYVSTVIIVLILTYFKVKGLPFALFINLFYSQMIVERSRDVHKNPGPTNNNEISIIHINARSLENKIDIIEIEQGK